MSDESKTLAEEVLGTEHDLEEVRDPGYLEDAGAREDDARDPFFMPGATPDQLQEDPDPNHQDSEKPRDGVIDVRDFVSAQAVFIAAQSAFLTRNVVSADDVAYTDALVRYSMAQGQFIEAQSEVLRQLGVV